MYIKADYNSDTIVVHTFGVDINISVEAFRHHILKYWHPLAKRFYLGTIYKNGQPVYTFDWAKIFSIAIEGSVIIEDFLKINNLIPVKSLDCGSDL